MVAKENIISRLFNSILMRALFVAIVFGLTQAAFALGLGEMRVKSALGQPLLVHTDIVGSETESLNPTCLRARVVTMDGIFIASAIITIHQKPKQRALSFSTRQAINEPAITLIIDINCETQLHRELSILLDPPDSVANASNAFRDDSPFAAIAAKSLTKAEISPVADKANKSDVKRKKPINLDNALDATFRAPELTEKRESKRKKNVKDAPRDVLRLSDDIVMQTPSQGLRMSDVLSSEAGSRLVENMQELREAQARMAAILRDEPQVASTTAPPASEIKPEDSKDIANLKRETEQLRKQNLLDKSALAKLQDKSGVDFWLIALAVIAIFAIVVILFLLVYIRRSLSEKNDTWWGGEEEALSAQPEKIEDVINNLQASYDTKAAANVSSSDALNKRNTGGKSVGDTGTVNDTSPKPSGFENSSFHRTPTLEETNSSIFNFFAPRGNSVKVEEISDVTQEAEFWISMNDPQRAIEILSAQEQLEQPDSPVPWLFLLDLYRTVNDRQKYDVLRDRFIIFFNANIPEFDVDLSETPGRNLEDFPHLTQKICDAWGSNDIIPYLESLLVDDREGKRAGFDLPVYRDILMLLGIAHELEKIMAIEGPLPASTDNQVLSEPIVAPDADPLAAAEINTIEFETIDFPIKLDGAKRSS